MSGLPENAQFPLLEARLSELKHKLKALNNDSVVRVTLDGKDFTVSEIKLDDTGTLKLSLLSQIQIRSTLINTRNEYRISSFGLNTITEYAKLGKTWVVGYLEGNNKDGSQTLSPQESMYVLEQLLKSLEEEK